MADQSDELIHFINSYELSAEFQPYAYYGADEDALTFYFRNDADFAKRISARVTVYLSLESGDLVGCQIKGVRRVLEELGEFDVTISHGKIKLRIVLIALMSGMIDDEETRKVYRQVCKRAMEWDIDVEVPNLISA